MSLPTMPPRPSTEEVDEAVAHELHWTTVEGGASYHDHGTILALEVKALRNELEYERNLRKAAQADTEELSAQLSTSAEVLP
jgi:hypothetical protein